MDWLPYNVKATSKNIIVFIITACLFMTLARIYDNLNSKDGICQNCGERYDYLHEKLEGIRYTECPECGQKLKKY